MLFMAWWQPCVATSAIVANPMNWAHCQRLTPLWPERKRHRVLGDVLNRVDGQGALEQTPGSGGWMLWEVSQDFGMG